MSASESQARNAPAKWAVITITGISNCLAIRATARDAVSEFEHTTAAPKTLCARIVDTALLALITMNSCPAPRTSSETAFANRSRLPTYRIFSMILFPSRRCGTYWRVGLWHGSLRCSGHSQLPTTSREAPHSIRQCSHTDRRVRQPRVNQPASVTTGTWGSNLGTTLVAPNSRFVSYTKRPIPATAGSIIPTSGTRILTIVRALCLYRDKTEGPLYLPVSKLCHASSSRWLGCPRAMGMRDSLCQQRIIASRQLGRNGRKALRFFFRTAKPGGGSLRHSWPAQRVCRLDDTSADIFFWTEPQTAGAASTLGSGTGMPWRSLRRILWTQTTTILGISRCTV